MKNGIKILLLECNGEDTSLIDKALKLDNMKFTSKRVDRKENFIHALLEFNPDVVIADHKATQFEYHSALNITQHLKSHVPFIIITDTVTEELETFCLYAGIDDYVLKTNLSRLAYAIKNSFIKKELEAENRTIKNLNDTITEKNKEILDSINYAYTLQQAAMQDKEELKEYFPDSFITLLPKHILSGDFFWFRNIGDSCIVVAADCTGHGVPGALLTIMGMGILHTAVDIRKIYSPSAILKFLDEELNQRFHNKSCCRNVSDGMDITICEINRKEKLLSFSGTNNPLYLIRNGEMQQFATDKYSMGANEPSKLFEETQIAIEENDMLYMSSDGFRDQFGGRNGKKLGSAHFRDLLLSLNKNSFNTQENTLLSTLTQWQGNEEQTDDILLIGIKL